LKAINPNQPSHQPPRYMHAVRLAPNN